MKKYQLVIEDTHGFQWESWEDATHLTKEQVEALADKYANMLHEGVLWLWTERGVRIFPAHAVHAVKIIEVTYE